MMWRVRGRTQALVVTMSIGTLIFILYRMAAGDMHTMTARDSQKLPRPPRGDVGDKNHIVIEDINEISSLTQNPKHLLRQRLKESHMLANIRRISEKKALRNQVNPEFQEEELNRVGILNGMSGVADVNEHKVNNGFKNQFISLPHRIVHLDLKGAPPKVSYFKEFFSLLKGLGATGVLVEYEDMFPYSGNLVHLAATNAYSKSDIKTILDLAVENNLEVIPLIQTFGHMEFVLKLKQYKDFREVPTYPQVICPTYNETYPLITQMIDQVLELHTNINYIHIGSDEVYYIGECSRCLQRMTKEKWGKHQIFLWHVKRIAQYIRKSYDIQPLMWDDEFRKVPESNLRESEIAKYVEIVVWKYTPDISAYITSDIWDKFGNVFGSVWLASSFKGATGSNQFITDVNYHLDNHRAWMDIVEQHRNRVVFKGIIITGWQRYDHFAVLCELLPVGIPSLAISLAYVQKKSVSSEVLKDVVDALKCDSSFAMTLTETVPGLKCGFAGFGVYDTVQRLFILKHEIERMFSDSTIRGWISSYNIDHGFSSPALVEHGTSELNRCKMELGYIEKNMRSYMIDIYDKYTVEEWVETFIKPLHVQLQNLWDAKEKLLNRTEWPRRPLAIENKDREL